MAAAALAGEEGAGVLVAGKHPLEVARGLRIAGPVLCLRHGRSADPSADWVAQQQQAGLVALTNPWVPGRVAWAGLDRVLGAAAELPQPVLATLTLGAAWFRRADVADELAARIVRAGVPVALDIGPAAFGNPMVLRLILALEYFPVLLLGSGTSAIGALCHGTRAAAVAPRTGMFVPALRDHYPAPVLRRVAELVPALHQLWRCRCRECHGTPLTELDDPETIARHSLRATLRIQHDLAALPTDADRISSWWQQCSHALAVHEQIAETILDWSIPRPLRTWFTETVDPLAVPGPRAEGDRRGTCGPHRAQDREHRTG